MDQGSEEEACEELSEEVSRREETGNPYPVEVPLRELAVYGGHLARRLAREEEEQQGDELDRHGQPI